MSQEFIDFDTQWDNLISWLETFQPNFKATLLVHSRLIPGAGRGLFTVVDVSPDTPLVIVPKGAQLNAVTLSALYGLSGNMPRLSATQIISMHLFLYRPEANGSSRDARFGPYISILPKSFASHPLTWMVLPSHESHFLLNNLTPSVTRQLNEMARNFYNDWEAVSRFLQMHIKILAGSRIPLRFHPTDHIEDFLWAWLNVNTRCIYDDLFSSQNNANNITLCPVIDLANHVSDIRRATTKSPIHAFSSPQVLLKAGSEVFLKYGSHPNRVLFVEYGFIEDNSHDGAEADAQDIIESLLNDLGELGKWMEQILKLHHFWGDWKLYDTPAPAQPSYRILPALRLLELSEHLSGIYKQEDPWSESPLLQSWQATITGEKDIVSEPNEKAVWKRLESICDIIIHRAEEGLLTLQKQPSQNYAADWMEYAVHCVEYLWQEELKVAKETKVNIKAGILTD